MQVAPRDAGGARLDADEAEDVLVLGLPQPEAERPEGEVEEHDGRPRRGGRQEQEGDHHQPGHEQPHDQSDHAAGEDRGGLPSELGLKAMDRAEGEASEDAADHVAHAGAEEDEQEGATRAGGAGSLAEASTDGCAERHEDHADAPGYAAAEGVAPPVLVVRHDAHPASLSSIEAIRPLTGSSAHPEPLLSRNGRG